MRRVLFVLLLIAGAAAGPAAAANREVTIFSAESAASGSYTDPLGQVAERTAGYRVVHFQVCGTGFSGTLSVKQGVMPTTVVETKALTISGLTGCSATYYIEMKPSAWTDFDYTRSAGTLTVYLELGE